MTRYVGKSIGWYERGDGILHIIIGTDRYFVYAVRSLWLGATVPILNSVEERVGELGAPYSSSRIFLRVNGVDYTIRHEDLMNVIIHNQMKGEIWGFNTPTKQLSSDQVLLEVGA